MLFAACSRADAPAAPASSAPITSSPAPVSASASPSTLPSAEAPAPPPPATAPKHYARVLHTGDSMVGGGLARALRPKFEADGAKYFRDVWESGSLREFAR